jgi:hypothetical protein
MNDQLIYGAHLLEMANNGLAVGKVQVNSQVTFAALTVNGILTPMDALPTGDYATYALATSSNNNYIVAVREGLDKNMYSYIYDVKNSQYKDVPSNIELLNGYKLTAVSNDGSSVGSGFPMGEYYTVGEICSPTMTCRIFELDAIKNADIELIDISDNSKYIVGQYVYADEYEAPFYITKNAGGETTTVLQDGFGLFYHSLDNDGVSIMYNRLEEGRLYLYSITNNEYYPVTEFIDSFHLDIDTSTNKNFKLRGLSNNGKYLYGVVLTDSTVPDADGYPQMVSVPWKIYFPQGIQHYLSNHNGGITPAQMSQQMQKVKSK